MILVKVFQELNRRKVRYLVAGGVAGILYGNPRLTKDLDLWVHLEEENLRKMVETFKALKFMPRTPVRAEDFISEDHRRRWQVEKGMKAFTFINPKNPFENVDILLNVPIDFDTAYRRKKWFRSGRVNIPTVAEKDLIRMKEKAGRPQDLQDIEVLKAILRKRGARSPKQ